MHTRHAASLMGKIVCLFSAVLLLGCMVISILTYGSEYEQALHSLRTQTTLMLSTTAQKIGERAAQVEIVGRELAFDNQVISLLQETNREKYMVQLLFDVQERIETSESHLSNLNADIILLEMKDDFPERYELIIQDTRLADDAYFQTFMQGSESEGWGPVDKSLSVSSALGQVMPYYRKVRVGLKNTIGVVRCAVSAASLFALPQDWTGGICVLRNGELLWQSAEVDWALPQSMQTGSWVEDNMLYAAVTVDSLSVTILRAESLETMKIGVMGKAVQNMGIVFAIGLLLLAVATAVINHMMMRLRQITRAVSELPEGDLSALALPEAGDDEAGQLSLAFSDLINRIDGYYTRLLKEEKDKRYARQLALQYQINPHFLFNALYWLQLRMEEQDVEEQISESVSQLGRVLHHNLTGKLDTLLSEEEIMARDYVSLVSSIKGVPIELEVLRPEDLGDCRIPCFCLQPILENAIRHGMMPGRTLQLSMRCAADLEQKRLTITVENDGRMIPPEQLLMLRQRLAHAKEEIQIRQESIGLINIQCRLELIYGQEASLDVVSDETSTRFILSLPLRRNKLQEVSS